jgi:hypothetical protein
MRSWQPADTEGVGGADDRVTVQFALTRSEYSQGLRDIIFRLPAVQGITAVAGLVALVSLALQSEIFWDAAFVLLTFAVILYVTPLLRWSRSPEPRCERWLSAGDEGVEIRIANGASRVAWSYFERVRETRTLFILVHDTRQGHIVPKRVLEAAGPTERFRSLVAEHSHLRSRGGWSPVLPNS